MHVCFCCVCFSLSVLSQEVGREERHRNNPFYIGVGHKNLNSVNTNGVLQMLQQSGIWARIEQQKPIFVEPKTKSEFCTAMENFYERVSTGDGAVFAAVCRGKVV